MMATATSTAAASPNVSMSWLDEDPATLQFALDLIDGNEGTTTWGDTLIDGSIDDNTDTQSVSAESDSTPPGSGSSSPAPSTATVDKEEDTSKNNKRQMVTNRSRNRRRDEVIYLRDKVKELEAALATIKQRTVSASSQDPRAQQEQEIALVWESIASRQSRQRQSAEVENAKLRAMLRGQLKVAKELMRVLQRGSRETLSLVPAMPVVEPVEHIDRLSTEARIAQLAHLYARIHSVFVTDHFCTPGLPRTFREIKVVDNMGTQDGTTVDVQVSWVVPFGAPRTAEALWRVMQSKGTSRECQPKEHSMGVDENLLVANFVATASSERMSGPIKGELLIRRYPEPGQRTFLTSIMLAEPLDPETSPFPNMSLLEEAWWEVRPVNANMALEVQGDANVLTQVRSRRRLRIEFHPGVRNGTQAPHRKAGEMTEFVLAQIEEELKFKQQMVENLLISSQLLS